MPLQSAFVLFLISIIWHLLLMSYHVMFTFFTRTAFQREEARERPFYCHLECHACTGHPDFASHELCGTDYDARCGLHTRTVTRFPNP